MNRRTFFLSAVAPQVLALPGLASRAFAKPKSKRRMTLGFSTYGTKSIPTERAIDLIADAGFEAVELTVWPGWDAEPANLSAARRKSIRQKLTNRGIKLTSLMEHVTPSADKNTQQAHMSRLQAVYELGRELSPGAPPVVQTVLGGGTWEQKKSLLQDRVAAWGELGNKHDMVTCVKPHRGGALSRPDEAIWLIKSLDSPKWLRMVYDYSHYIFRDIALIQSIRQAAPFTAHVAVKDTIKDGNRMRFVLPGEAGTIDFVTLLKEFHRAGYTGDISCEVSGMVWGKSGYDPQAAIKTCFANMSKAFNAAMPSRYR